MHFARTSIGLACAFALAVPAHALSPQELELARVSGTLKELLLTGSSSLSLTVGAYVQDICTATSFDVYHDDGGTGASVGDGVYVVGEDGTAYRAYSCNLRQALGNYAAGTPVLIHKRDLGGSVHGARPIQAPAQIGHMTVSTATCVANQANAAPAEDVQIPTYLCQGTVNAYPDAGITDVELALLQAPVNQQTGQTAIAIPASLNAGSLVQVIYGVAVNKKAYRALQATQGIIGPGAPMLDMPADQNSWTAAHIATMPSLPLAWVRGALIGSVVGGPSAARGWNRVISPAIDPLVIGKTINVCRRVEGSGTQAASTSFFALSPCQSGYNAALTVGGIAQLLAAPGAAGVNGTVGVRVSSSAYSEATSAANVETCLGRTVENAVNPADATDNAAYGLAVLGRELNPQANASDRGYRYVKLDGQVPTRLAAKAGE